MRNLFESISVGLVFLLSLLIVYLIVQYNLIEDDIYKEVKISIPVKKEVSKKEKINSYLKNIEGYSDVDVEVDPTKENTLNRVIIDAEEGENNNMEEVIKGGYVDIIEDYSDENKHNTNQNQNKEVVNVKEPIEESIPSSMPDTEDKIGSAIDNLLGEL